MANPKIITLVPRVSEKTYAQSEQLNTYAFEVPMSANKHTIRSAVEQQFKVTVNNVNVLRRKGKVKRSFRKRTQPLMGRRSDTKKAYVTLKKGDSITIFEEGK